jgi:hypothetical protein
MRSTLRRINSRQRVRGRAFIRAMVAVPFVAGVLMGGLVPHAAAATSAKLSPGGIFGGYTTKGWPVVIEVSRNGKRIKRAVAGIEASCTSGAIVTLPDTWRDLPIRGRRFKGAFTDSDPDGGLVYEFSDSIQGAINRKRTRISGTWSEKVTIRDAAGVTVDTCDSGRVPFTARR